MPLSQKGRKLALEHALQMSLTDAGKSMPASDLLRLARAKVLDLMLQDELLHQEEEQLQERLRNGQT